MTPTRPVARSLAPVPAVPVSSAGSGVLAPQKPAEGVEGIEDFTPTPPGCSWRVGPALDPCGTIPVKYRLVVCCGCVTLMCSAHVDTLVAFLVRNAGRSLFCAICGAGGLSRADFRVVPL